MSQSTDNKSDGTRNWTRAAIAGVVVAVVYNLLTGAGLGSSGLMGVIFAVVAGFVLNRRASTEGDVSAQSDTPVETAAAVVAEPAAMPADPVSETAPDAEPAVADAAGDATDVPVTMVKLGTQLPGEAELAARKGSWRYEGKPASA
ncbi:hypothetical protein LCL97_05120 [Seohaeicola saemankumensis]|nr:hypothetical protein [Seohaeicola saemankumensis]MCA0870191.1 hypothetical protein [Seohaeicola saemankumensis]